jgi:DNA primase
MFPCPFHNDNNPSFGMHKETLVSNCFKCGGFNALQFIIKYKKEVLSEDSSYRDAIDLLKTLSGNIEVNYELDELRYKLENLNNKDKNKETEDIISAEQLPEGLVSAANHKYLLNCRELSNKIIKRFNLKYCKYGKYAKRVIVPIYEMDRYRGFIARDVLPFLIGKDKVKKKYPERGRVLNSFGMDEEKFLFNFDNVLKIKDCLVLKKYGVFLVEGIFDAIKLWQLRVPALAMMGSSLKDGQLKIIDEYFDKFVLCTDNDKAGFEANKRINNKLIGNNIKVCIYESSDPGELQTREQIKRIISFDEWNKKESYTFLGNRLNHIRRDKDG